jgi:MurNAc alpha-1-phosphate uridylyltransferase
MSAPAVDNLPPLALLAGGLATRLRPITATVPKSMIEVAGEPFIAHQLRLLVRNGIREVVVCCGFLGEQIEAFVRDGREFGCSVRYSYDGEPLKGTGGAIRRALPLLGKEFFVMYGDSYLPIAFQPVYDEFVRSGRSGLMTVFRNEGRWDKSNVEFVDQQIRRYDKQSDPGTMCHIDYGLGILRRSAFDAWSCDDIFDLAAVYRDLLARGQLAACEVFARFYEIGTISGLNETSAMLQTSGS